MSKDDVKNLKFGEVTKPKLIKRLGEQPRYIDVDISEIQSGSFPANDSEEVRQELKQVTREMSQFEEDGWTDDDMEETDLKPLQIFTNFLDSEGIHHDADFLEELYTDVARIVIKLKVFYNRPRPEQLGPLLGFDFSAVTTSTDNSPSFPSGHTMQAWTLAHYLSNKHPEHKSGFYDIARKIERSRLVRGAHYPSDNGLSKFVAKHHLAPNIKESS